MTMPSLDWPPLPSMLRAAVLCVFMASGEVGAQSSASRSASLRVSLTVAQPPVWFEASLASATPRSQSHRAIAASRFSFCASRPFVMVVDGRPVPAATGADVPSRHDAACLHEQAVRLVARDAAPPRRVTVVFGLDGAT